MGSNIRLTVCLSIPWPVSETDLSSVARLRHWFSHQSPDRRTTANWNDFLHHFKSILSIKINAVWISTLQVDNNALSACFLKNRPYQFPSQSFALVIRICAPRTEMYQWGCCGCILSNRWKTRLIFIIWLRGVWVSNFNISLINATIKLRHVGYGELLMFRTNAFSLRHCVLPNPGPMRQERNQRKVCKAWDQLWACHQRRLYHQLWLYNHRWILFCTPSIR